MKSIRLALFVAVFTFGVNPLFADTITGPSYPAPGNNSFSSSGVSGTGSGATLSYGTFDPTQYSQLWWGPSSVQNVCSGGNCNTGNMTFSNYNSGTGVAEWDSSTNWVYTDGFGGGHNYQTRFLLTFLTDPGDVTSQAAAGISGNSDSVLKVMGNYQVKAQFQAFVGGVWVATNDEYNSVNEIQGNSVVNSFSGGFWSTPPPSATPEPGSLILLGSGLLTFSGVLRRRMLHA